MVKSNKVYTLDEIDAMDAELSQLDIDKQEAQEAFLDQQDIEDKIEAQEEAEEMQEKYEGIDMGMADSVPHEQKQDTLFKLFGEVWRNEDPDLSSKVANLSNMELGRGLVSVRDARNLAQLGILTGHAGWAKFWNEQARMTNETSMSKNGWFSTLFVSQKKFTTRNTANTGMPLGDITAGKKKKPWKLFGKHNDNSDQSGFG